jgi:short-subunit dehydrogenase
MAHRGSWKRFVALGVAAGVYAIMRARRARRESLAGQVALVTGGSRGLGLLVAEELTRAGCRVVICARDAEELARAREVLARRGAEVLTVLCDVAQPDDVARLVATALEHFEHIDLLVNNAGIIQVGPFDAFTLDDFRAAVSVNFWGAVHTTLAVAPHMRARRAGRIVNVTSIGGKVAVPHLLPYDAAKFALVGFSEGLHAELARDGVSVTTVVPGLMRTGGEDFADGRTNGDARWFKVAARLPGLSMDPRHAARRIVAAARRRDAEIVVGAPAKLLRLVKDAAPSFLQATLGVGNRALPRAPAS